MPKINWDQFYQDLPEKVANLLREARIKPDKLKTKSDGDILSIAGITETDLETIKSKYSSDIIEIESNKAEEKKQETLKKEKEEEAETKVVSSGPRAKYPRVVYGRSKRYKSLLSKVDKDKHYSIEEAVKSILKLSHKGQNIDLHLNTQSNGLRGEIKLPFSTGKQIRIEIFSDKTIVALNDNKSDFDLLLATPQDMPKLARFAKILGPRGLMPNPKNGTVTDNPEKRAKELSSGASVSYKTEPKFPIIHLNVGKSTQKPEELCANIIAIIKEIGSSKIKSAYLTGNQTPSFRIAITSN